MRIGFGSDLHRLVPGGPLRLGGIDIPSDLSSEGHSDGDAVLHAITDAVLGALAEGDIGSHFPPSEEKWKDADSAIFVTEVVGLMKARSYAVGNVDVIVNLERPRLRPYIDEMREAVAILLETDIGNVSLKAKTGEGLDAVGENRAIKAEACILLIDS